MRFGHLATVIVSSLFLTQANAALVSIVSQSTSLPIAPLGDNISPDFQVGVGGTYNAVLSGGSVSGSYRSPYEDLSQNIPAGFETAPYSSVRLGSFGYNFLGGATTLSILWGSPDSYNTLQFYDNKNGTGNLLSTASITGTGFTGLDLIPPATQGLAHDYVTFSSSVAFLSVVLTSSTAAFEYAGLTFGSNAPALTPIPPALVLFGSALVGLAALGRRRRRSSVAG